MEAPKKITKVCVGETGREREGGKEKRRQRDRGREGEREGGREREKRREGERKGGREGEKGRGRELSMGRVSHWSSEGYRLYIYI